MGILKGSLGEPWVGFWLIERQTRERERDVGAVNGKGKGKMVTGKKKERKKEFQLSKVHGTVDGEHGPEALWPVETCVGQHM